MILPSFFALARFPATACNSNHGVTLIWRYPAVPGRERHRWLGMVRGDPFIFHGILPRYIRGKMEKGRWEVREADGHSFFSRWKNHTGVYERYYCLIYVYDDRALFLRFPGKKEYRFLRIIHFGINLSSFLYCFPRAFPILPHFYTVTSYLCRERGGRGER